MKETPMRQARLVRYLVFQAYLLAFIQRSENIMYQEVLLIRKVYQNQQEYTSCMLYIIQPSGSADRKRFMQKVKRINLESGSIITLMCRTSFLPAMSKNRI